MHVCREAWGAIYVLQHLALGRVVLPTGRQAGWEAEPWRGGIETGEEEEGCGDEGVSFTTHQFRDMGSM